MPTSTSDGKRRKKRTSAKRAASSPRPRPPSQLPSDRTEFAHISERQYARLLDFYEINWDYEPRSFDVEWDDEGNVTKRFTPDFYLPDFDMYIEVTTMSQKLVTRKNRKVRRLRELYPGVSIKIFYQRDYVQLLAKYGLDGRGSLGG
ncbi:MAG: hypothetical protein ACRDJ1_00595 [Actinomycetota bacterium]